MNPILEIVLNLNTKEELNMNINKEKKKEILLKNFEIIKNNYAKNEIAISDVVVKMFGIDIDTAVEMWIYLIKKYEHEVKGYDSLSITGGISHYGGETIGKATMDEIILNTPELKNAFFSLMCRHTSIYDSDIIRRRISANDLITANELLELLFNNPYREDSWYRIMDDSMPWSDCEITTEAYELLEMWCEKVEDEEERAKLAIKMLNYFD